ncbi:MAG: (Fe-S)-binding protein [Rhodospirillales bacterium]|nr:(Fe-S)-binding protein [Rhodospirillales bacterium]
MLNPDEILANLDARTAALVADCTACGACVRACPTPAVTGNDVTDPKAVAAGIIALLSGRPAPENARRWATECCGSGQCLDVCDAGINPRFMLTMARRAITESEAQPVRRAAGKQAFKSMSRGVRVLARLQLPPELMERLSPSSHPDREAPPDLVFYTGCNMLKTPHIGLLCLDVLDQLGASYEVFGGPSDCCGILQLRPGDTANATRQAGRTLQRVAARKPAALVSWCPTCQMQFSETMLAGAAADDAVAMKMLPVYLAGRLDQLRPLMTQPVRKRVALHEYPGSPGVIDSVKALPGAIPGLELVDLGVTSLGYQLTSLSAMPQRQNRHIAESLQRAEAAGVTTLAGIFHADHRELVAHENQWPFEIINYMELLGQSMGLARTDIFKRLKLMQDVDAVIADTTDMIEAHGLDLEEVRDVVLKDMLEDQYLPLDRSLHPRTDGSVAS